MSNYYAITTTFIPGQKVRSDEVNAELAGISAGFDNLPTSTEAIIRGTSYKGTESGTGNSYILTMDDTRSSYVAGDRVFFRATHTNTGATNINVDGLGLKSLVKADGDPCTAGDIISGLYYDAVYDVTGNQFQLLSVNANIIADSSIQAGYSQEWATNPEDTLISTAAGGNGTTDYSSLHWAAKAAADVLLTNADVVSTNADVVLTNADVVLTNADVVLTNADVVSTDNNVTYSSEWAIKAEDVLISVAAGGNGTTDYSALHWAAKAAASASAASTSETNAEGYATAASGDAVATAADLVQTNLDQISCDADATAAAASAAAALVSENNAAASYDSFDDRYLGSKASDPTLDNDGAALLTGALYWNSVNNTMRAYSGTVWQDVGSSTANVTEFTATAGQTTFSGADDNAKTLSYTSGFLQVYLNGVLLENTTDYTATNGTSIVLTSGAAAGDMLQGFGFGTFDIANHYTKTEIDANKYDKTEVDANTYTRTQVKELIPRRNMIINGDFDVSQRNGAITGVASTDWPADRWRVYKSGAAVWNTSFATAHTSGIEHYMHFVVTTADASLAAGDYLTMQQQIEGRTTRRALFGSSAAKDITLSFWHAHTKTGTHSVTIRNGDSTRYYTAEYTQTTTNTWEKAEITIPGDTSGTWATDGTAGLGVLFNLYAGSTYSTAASSAWATGLKFGTTNSVNNGDSVDNFCRFAQVQLEVGSEATAYEYKTYHENYLECMRYYEKSFSASAYPGVSASYVGAKRYTMVQDATATGDNCHALSETFLVMKRATPTMTAYAPSTGTVDKVYDISNSTDRALNTINKSNVHHTGWPVLTGSRTTGTVLTWHWTAESEIS